MKDNVMVVGRGGREHALVWKLRQSPHVRKIFCVPGNAGTAKIATNVRLDPLNFAALVKFARAHKVTLVVPGPDRLYAAGIVDYFQQAGLTIFGPTKAAAELEWSKSFASGVMDARHIPRATTLDAIRGAAEAELYYLKRGRRLRFPVVVKADGLMEGKGVYIVHHADELRAALQVLYRPDDPESANRVVNIDQFLRGVELSGHLLTDSIVVRPFPFAHDYKKALDGDEGDNTGGMGCVAPIGVSKWFRDQVRRHVEVPALAEMERRGRPFRGLLYPGLIVPRRGFKVLEYNVRFGDPETQAYMLLMASDLFEQLMGCAMGTLSQAPPLQFREGYAVCVVLACDGYPGKSISGQRLLHLAATNKIPNLQVFHAGTVLDGKTVRATGGRTFAVTALGETLDSAITSAYAGAHALDQHGLYFRHDIGADVLAAQRETR